MRVTKAFDAWWQGDLEGGNSNDQGHRVHHRVVEPSVTTKVGEESQELDVEEKVIKMPKEVAEQGKEMEEGVEQQQEDPPSKVSNIDALLGDIYKLKYQLSQVNACMYRYWVDRDRYMRERDEACTSLHDSQAR